MSGSKEMLGFAVCAGITMYHSSGVFGRGGELDVVSGSS